MRRIAAVAALAATAFAAHADPLVALDLSRPFATRSPWRLTATQGSDVPDPIGEEDKVPGAVALCLSKDGGRTCDPVTRRALVVDGKPDLFSEPHWLGTARIVHPRGGPPLLLLHTGSLRSGDGDRRNATQLLAYDRTGDAFRLAYGRTVGSNNNQEIRYVDGGPLAGTVIAAEPTQDAPFAFWIDVDRLASSGRYARVLRYRSATRYGDGNTLAVIDSEMPAIERRLGLWRPGEPLPLPAGGCPRPRLSRGALWCR